MLMIRFILSFTLCAANPDEILSRLGQATAAALKSKATESSRVAALAVVEAVVAAREPHETLNAIASEA